MILATALLVSLSVLTLSRGGNASSMDSREEQEAYLKRYAYMGSSSHDPRYMGFSSHDPQLASLTDPTEMFRMAVMKFQWMAGINETGVVDEETVKMMEMPRCGLPDEVGMSMVTKRRRRRRYAAQGSRWRKTGLTYRINNYTPDLPQHVTDSEIQTAFKVTDRTKTVDIDIYFGSQDGPGETLAYAYYPRYGGDAYFDDDEQWTSRINSGINLLEVAIHEFGHSLGLRHSNVSGSIMAPYYRGYRPNVQLHTDDIAGIRSIYGSIYGSTTSMPPSMAISGSIYSSTTRMPPSAHAICGDPTVDAIFAVNEDVYIFKGAQYYMGRRLRFLSSARPIRDDWPGLPDNIDTAVYLDGYIVFFKGHQCWRYSSTRQPMGLNPQNISTVFSGLPSKIDAAFVWSGNGNLYLISGDIYYKMPKRPNYTYRVDSGYPRHLKRLSIWKGLPSRIDAAFNYTNERTYIFSGSNFYRFDDDSREVDSGYPKSTATHWFGCADRLESQVKETEEDMMEKEWMAGGDQFVTDGVGLPTYSVLLATIAALALCLLFT